ncbi:hypothetical protein D2T29_06330 [Sinirhodobacter populi]|uniref:3-deoxy-D-manno-octulosonic acid transferase n=2 Tax=Paenirhodobacter populi TaxID=2306993 RepID=A0A443KM10_9RHOB|nr:hypothetical protein D2T29_06330 [Sinirhodobacter populi]
MTPIPAISSRTCTACATRNRRRPRPKCSARNGARRTRMRRSFLLWLRLLVQRPRVAGAQALAAAQVPRPDGSLIWVIVDPAPDVAASAGLLLRRLVHARPGTGLLVSLDAPVADLPPGVIRIARPEDCPAAAALMLSHWRPGLIVLMGNSLPAALIALAKEQGIPVMAVDMRRSEATRPKSLAARRIEVALLSRLDRIILRDAESQTALHELGVSPSLTEVGGALSEPPEPLHCSEAERASIAAITRTRPVWLAAAVPDAELRMVLDAHTHAARHAHRMLLILAPETGMPADGLAAELEAQGWVTGQRSIEGEPEEEMQIFLADDPGEYGLWFRIAPVTYMGGTLSGAGTASRSPLDPAALGSAILHGPETGAFAAEYARLETARAARQVTDARSLGEAVSDLMAPDRAAMLAHNAWVVTSGGAGAAEAVAHAILSVFDTHAVQAAEAG